MIFLCFTTLQATEDVENMSQLEITLSAECEPLTCVHDCVNVQSGQFFQVNQDFVGNTIDPLCFNRFYDSGNYSMSTIGSGFGSQFPLHATTVHHGDKHSYAMISEREGFMLPYRCRRPCYTHRIIVEETYQIDPRVFKKGYTNASKSSKRQENLINRRATLYNYFKNEWMVKLGNGTERVYAKPTKLDHRTREHMGFPTKVAYLLTEERKPNGNKIHYQYDIVKGKPFLSKITTMNRTGNTILNSLTFNYSENGCQLKSSCGQCVDYILKPDPTHAAYILKGVKILEKVVINNQLNGFYKVDSTKKNKKDLSRVVSVERPCGGFTKIRYNSDRKVEALSEPLGPNNEERVVVRFEYKKHHTDVWNALGHKCTYHFDSQDRLEHIDTYDQNQIVKQEIFEWSQHPDRQGWLKSKSLCLGKNIYHKKKYEYDSKGNIVRETIRGNLTGKGSEFFTSSTSGDNDNYTVEYEYSNDDRNLLVSEKKPEGLQTRYAYLDHTNLRTKKLVVYDNKIQERTFYSYDDNGQLEKIIEDDGSGEDSHDLTNITYRRLKTIQSVKDQGPSFGKPAKVEEACLENGQIKPLKSIEFLYDKKGNEIEQKFHDHEKFCYSIKNAYDDRFRLIETVDPIGQTTQFAYDENNNKIEEKLIGSGKTTRYQYDCAKRLTSKSECHDDGKVFTTTYKYNLLNQLTSEQNSYGHETFYSYDRLGRQIESKKPSIPDSNGGLKQSIKTQRFNVLDQLIEETDENGLTTKYKYNVYGQPTYISRPDGSQEWLTYNCSACIRERKFADGSRVSYLHDPKGRITNETVHSANGEVLSQTSYTYKGLLLNSKTEPLGITTQYRYDGAGRKMAEIIGEKKTIKYENDAFGRITTQTRVLDESAGLSEYFTYDWLDRVISKTLKDSQGNIYSQEFYEYDHQNNRLDKAIFRNDQDVAHYRSEYNTDGTPLTKTDPHANKIQWQYDHHHINQHSQKVVKRTVLDHLGRQSVEEYDVLHRLSKKTVYNEGKPFAITSFYYDAKGNEVKQLSQVMSEGELLREYGVLYTYNHQGLVASETEVPTGKTTKYQYDFKGRLSVKEKPDGITIHYAYDALDRIKSFFSSDGSVKYSFIYDLHKGPREIHDEVHQIVQRREYDSFDRLISEELSPGVILKYDYDPLDRLIKTTLPDGSYVTYKYNPCYLEKIERYDARHELKYTYECSSYDWSGHLLCGKCPAGSITTTYDLMGRAVKIEAMGWASELLKFDSAGNLLEMQLTDPEGHYIEQLKYDRFNHLISESSNEYTYDSIGNCIQKNVEARKINELNQVTQEASSEYAYDLNGNLISQSHPSTTYKYDAINRLSEYEQEGLKTRFIYDAFGRLLMINDGQLIYQKNQEIGMIKNGQIQELRLVHPEEEQEKTFVIELGNHIYYPIQDYRNNICALRDSQGGIVQWYRHSSFNIQSIGGNENIHNPWRFGNRREIGSLILYTHRFYHPQLMRWLTTDPIGFSDGLNMYAFNHNNPYYYQDLDGQFAFVIPFLIGAFEAGSLTVAFSPLSAVLGSLAGAVLGYAVYNIDSWYDNKCDAEAVEEEPVKTKDEPTTGRPNSGSKTEEKKKEEFWTEPRTLEEKLTLDEAKAIKNGKEAKKLTINDPRYPSETWKKCSLTHQYPDPKIRRTEVHWWENRITGEKHGFKFKG